MVAHLCVYHILCGANGSFEVWISKSVKEETYPVEHIFVSQVVVKVLEDLPGFTIVAYLKELDSQLHDTMSRGRYR